jgi:hypothetical protein
MSATKSIIEQADEIVGITGEVRIANVNSTTYRRGAYVGWLLSNHEADETMVCGTVAHSAECIVRLHAASKPKPMGDGLPEEMSASIAHEYEAGEDVWFVAVGPTFCDSKGPALIRDYLNRCLAPPVRRLLAAFEVVDEKPERDGIGIPHVSVHDGTVFLDYVSPSVCWLVPKGVRP